MRLASIFLLIVACECEVSMSSDGGAYEVSPAEVRAEVGETFRIRVLTTHSVVEEGCVDNIRVTATVSGAVVGLPTETDISGGEASLREVSGGIRYSYPPLTERETRMAQFRCDTQGLATIMFDVDRVEDCPERAQNSARLTPAGSPNVSVVCGEPPSDGGGTTDAASPPITGSMMVAATGSPVPGLTDGVGEIVEWGVDNAGAVSFLSSNGLQNELVRLENGELTLISERSALQAALGESEFFALNDLRVAHNGTVSVHAVTDDQDCLLAEDDGVFLKLMCIGDEIAGGGPLDQMRLLSYQDDHALIRFRSAIAGGNPDGDVQLARVTSAGPQVIAQQSEEVELTTGRTMRVSTLDNATSNPDEAVYFRAVEQNGHTAIFKWRGQGLRDLLFWIEPFDGEALAPAPIPDGNVLQYPAGIRPFDGLATSVDGWLVFLNHYLNPEGEPLAGAGIYATQNEAGTGAMLRTSLLTPAGSLGPVALAPSGLPLLRFAATAGGEAVYWAARTDGSEGVYQTPDDTIVLRTGDAAPPTVDGSLPSEPRLESLGPMIANAKGDVAIVAQLSGGEIDSSNERALIAIGPAGPVIVARHGDPFVIGGVERTVGAIRLHSNTIASSFVPGGFDARNVRDSHVVRGSGADGYGTSFNTHGCGQVLYLVASAEDRSAMALVLHTLAGDDC